MSTGKALTYPKGWIDDGKIKVKIWRDMLIITHPEHPPHKWNKDKQKWEKITKR